MNQKPGAIPRTYTTPIWVRLINRLRLAANYPALSGQQECQIAEIFQVFLYVFSAIGLLAVFVIFAAQFIIGADHVVKFFAVSIFFVFIGLALICKKLS